MSIPDAFSKSTKLPRSPSRNVNTTFPPEEYNCNSCAAPDSAGNMVQCDKCDLWYHYVCAGVDSFIAEEDWICKMCAETQVMNGGSRNVLTVPANPTMASGSADVVTERPRRRTSNASKSKCSKSSKSSSERRLQIELQKLEEERKLKEIRDQEERELKEKRDQEYIDKKYKILNQLADELSETDEEDATNCIFFVCT